MSETDKLALQSEIERITRKAKQPQMSETEKLALQSEIERIKKALAAQQEELSIYEGYKGIKWGLAGILSTSYFKTFKNTPDMIEKIKQLSRKQPCDPDLYKFVAPLLKRKIDKNEFSYLLVMGMVSSQLGYVLKYDPATNYDQILANMCDYKDPVGDVLDDLSNILGRRTTSVLPKKMVIRQLLQKFSGQPYNVGESYFKRFRKRWRYLPVSGPDPIEKYEPTDPILLQYY